jgi:hypothetical protein
MDTEAVALEILRREIAKRLRSVCVDVPEKEFESVVERLAQLERRYERLDAPGLLTVPIEMNFAQPPEHGEVT